MGSKGHHYEHEAVFPAVLWVIKSSGSDLKSHLFIQAGGGKVIIMTMGQQASLPWLKDNVAVAMSQGVPLS